MAMMGALAHAPVFAQSVAVTSIVEHPALDSIKDGVQEALAKAGYTEAKGLKWQFQTAKGNTAIAAQIDRKSDVSGKTVSVGVDLGGSRILKTTKYINLYASYIFYFLPIIHSN